MKLMNFNEYKFHPPPKNSFRSFHKIIWAMIFKNGRKIDNIYIKSTNIIDF